jgi:dTDP-D-glucose 4,6-dehydratase
MDGAGFADTSFVHEELMVHPDEHIVLLDRLTYTGVFRICSSDGQSASGPAR